MKVSNWSVRSRDGVDQVGEQIAVEIVTGHYRFGANELSIYRALVKIIDMLEVDYGLKVPR